MNETFPIPSYYSALRIFLCSTCVHLSNGVMFMFQERDVNRRMLTGEFTFILKTARSAAGN